MISEKTKVQRIQCDENKRIIAISDIHGEVDYLNGVLEKANYTTDDILVIIGDVIEKGRESLKTVRRIIELQEANSNVYVTIGNVDYDRIRGFLDDTPEGEEGFLGGLFWTKDAWKRGFFLDILDEIGVDVRSLTTENFQTVKKQIKESYHRELSFFYQLPTILIMGEYIFVHGGIPTDNCESLEGTHAFGYMKIDAFIDSDVKFHKNVVVGHWPTCLTRKDEYCMNPIMDYDKHIIAIDGGCGIKRQGGQLNALLIPNAYADIRETRFVYFDPYPVITVPCAQAGKASTLEIRFFDAEVELLEEKGEVVVIRHLATGKTLEVPPSYLWNHDGKLSCVDYTDALLDVAEGEKVSFIESNTLGMLVKRDGTVGWYKGGQDDSKRNVK